MRLKLNGEAVEVDSADLVGLIEAFEFNPQVVATAVNGEFVARAERQDVVLKDGDSVEILSPRQGG